MQEFTEGTEIKIARGFSLTRHAYVKMTQFLEEPQASNWSNLLVKDGLKARGLQLSAAVLLSDVSFSINSLLKILNGDFQK